jgi:purine catabolism regulator
MTECDGYICALLAGKQAQNSMIKGQKEELDRLQKTMGLRIAISDRYHRLLDSYSLFQDLKYVMGRWEKPGILYFDQVKMELLIRRIKESQIPVHRYLSNVIMKVIEYDKENDSAYFETLEAYCNCGKNVAKTAEVLYVHKNTITYRIQRIQEMTGVDFDDAQSWLHICMSLALMEQNI